MDNHQTTRRGMLGVIAIASAAPLAAVGTIARAAPGATDLIRAVARYRAASAAEDHFDATELVQAEAAHERAVDAFNRAWPHKVFKIGGRDMSTDDWRTAAGIRRDMTNIRFMERCCWDGHRNDMAFLDAYDARKAALDALPERKRLDAMTDRSDYLLDARCAARDAVIKTPVASLGDLATKFDFLEECGCLDLGDNPEFVAALRADIARLAAGGLN